MVVEPAGAQVVRIDAPQRGHHAQRELLARHFHAEHRHRALAVQRRVFGDIHREAGFSHGRPARNDHQVGALQPRRLVVEQVETGGNAGDRFLVAIHLLDSFHRAPEQVVDRLETLAVAGTLLGDLEHLALGLVEQFLARSTIGIICAGGDFVADLDQAAQHRVFAHDVGIGLDVDRGRGVVGQDTEIGQPAGRVEFATRTEPFRDRHHVVGLVSLGQRGDGTENQAMIMAVKVLLVDDVGDFIPRAVVQHQATDDRLFCLQRVRRNLQIIDTLAQFRDAGRDFRHSSGSGASTWTAYDKPFLAASKRKRPPRG